MTEEHAEIAAALESCNLIPGSFDKLLVRNWNIRRCKNQPMTEVGVRHVYRLLHKYRAQIPATFEKFKDHPSIKIYNESNSSSLSTDS